MDPRPGWTTSRSRCRAGRTATRAPGSRCSARPGCRATRSRRSRTRRRCNAVTGLAPRVSLHIPWDRVDDYGALATHAKELGVTHRGDQLQPVPGRRLQARLAHPRRRADPGEGRRAPPGVHRRSCARPGPRDLKIWLPDGTNYAGQDSLRGAAGAAGRLAASRSTRRWTTTSGCCWSTSSSSRTSTRWTSRTGARRCCTAWRWASGRRSCWTPATTRRAPTSSSS